jgi:hypothetical protein
MLEMFHAVKFVQKNCLSFARKRQTIFSVTNRKLSALALNFLRVETDGVS